MGSEIEIKLGISREEDIGKILGDARLGADFGEFAVISMNARYYDTRELDLLARNYVVRIRKENGANVATLKKRHKELDSGVMVREEWNHEVPSNSRMKLSYFTEVEEELEGIVGHKELVEIVETDFIRRILNVEFQGSQLEMAVDHGKIISKGQEVPIMEVEIELKEGEAEAITGFMEEYLQEYQLPVEMESKFRRGVDLFLK